MQKMTYEERKEVKEIINRQEPDFLIPAKMVNRRITYVCPCCDNGSGKKLGYGITYSDRYEKWKCFSCGKSFDVIDLAMEANNQNFAEAIDWLSDYYDIVPSGSSADRTSPTIKKSLSYKAYQDETDYSDYIRKAEEPENYDYLKWRGISVETQRRFHVGYDAAWKHPKSDGSITYPVCIIPTSNCSYLARSTHKESEETGFVPKNAKMKVGQVHIWNLEELASDRPYVFIAEGEIDAMSIEECGHPAIGLGSAGNAARLVDIWSQSSWKKDTVFVIGDMDKSGNTCSKLLETELVKNGLCKQVVNLKFPKNCTFKDPNEFLMRDREWFRNWLNASVSECKGLSIIVPDKLLNALNEASTLFEMDINDLVVSMLEEMCSTMVLRRTVNPDDPEYEDEFH